MNAAKSKSGRSGFCSPLWIIGLICSMSASGCDVMALNYGNQILLSSMTSMGIIFNSILSVIFLKESFTKGDALSIFIICFGATIFMVNAKNQE